MKLNEDSFKCLYEIGSVYLLLFLSIVFFFMSILMVLIILLEKIYSIYLVIFCGIFVYLAIAALVISLYSRDKKFVINAEECKVESRKGILFSTKTQSIRRIVILAMPRASKKYIIFDCEEYPFLVAQDFLYLKILRIRYTSRRLKNIRKYCPNCKLEEETLLTQLRI